MPRIKTDRTSEIDRAIGAALLTIRTARGISQSELADRLGVSFQQIQKYEQGTNRLSASVLVLIARELEVSPMTFLGEFFDYEGTGDVDLLKRLADAEDRLMQINALSRTPVRSGN